MNIWITILGLTLLFIAIFYTCKTKPVGESGMSVVAEKRWAKNRNPLRFWAYVVTLEKK